MPGHCSPSALPAASKDPEEWQEGPTEQQEDPTEQQENHTEQHEHCYLDLGGHLCKGCRRHGGGGGPGEGQGGQAGAEGGVCSNRDAWPGKKVAGWGRPWAGFSLAACPCCSFCLFCLQTGGPYVSYQASPRPTEVGRTMSHRQPQAQPLCPLQRCPRSGRNLPWSPRIGVELGAARWRGPSLGQRTQHGLFFLWGLGQILPLL